MVPAIYVVVGLLAVLTAATHKTCPDGSYCIADGTCCRTASKKFTCCPLPHAVCCPDREHCCPRGYVCDNETDACKPSHTGGMAHAVFLSRAFGNVNRVPDSYVACDPQDDTACPSSHTCCTTTLGNVTKRSCCPSRDAVCCTDGKHCCPKGAACDLTAGRCVHNDVYVQESRTLALTPARQYGKKRTSSPRPVSGTIVPCSDGRSHCPDGYTCCVAPSGSYSCCPLKDAVCCDDNVHCCPHGTVCNPDRGACQKKGLSHVPWSTKVPAAPLR